MHLLETISALVTKEELWVSDHGFARMRAHNVTLLDVLNGLRAAEIIEEYPEYHKGPCVLVLQKDSAGAPVHVLWGIPKGASAPASLITAYRPDPDRWTSDFKTRRPKT